MWFTLNILKLNFTTYDWFCSVWVCLYDLHCLHNESINSPRTDSSGEELKGNHMHRQYSRRKGEILNTCSCVKT